MRRWLASPLTGSVLLSALLMVFLAIAAVWWLHGDGAVSAPAREIALSELRFMMGAGEVEHGVLEVNQYTSGRAIVSYRGGRWDASDYRYLSFVLSPVYPSEDLPLFFWRSAASGELHTTPLEENLIDHLDLRRHPEWRRQVSEWGFMFQRGGQQAWLLRDIVFFPDTPMQSMASILSDWSEFEVWAQHTTNLLYGGGANSRWSLTVVIAAWVFSTLIIYAVLSRISGRVLQGWQVAAILLAGWMLFDARWIYNLLQQAQTTTHVYAGKTQDEQYRAGLDADYYRYFERLRTQVLPSEAQFIYVLDNKTDYYRSRIPWLMAPHNIFNVDRYPRIEYATKGGYILVLEQISGLQFDMASQTLRWQKNMMPAEEVDRDVLGVLYRITAPHN